MIDLGIFIIGLLEYNYGGHYQEVTLFIAGVGFFGLAICSIIIVALNDSKPRWKK